MIYRSHRYGPLYRHLATLPVGHAAQFSVDDLTALLGPPRRDGIPCWSLADLARLLKDGGIYSARYDRPHQALIVTRREES